MILVAAKNQSSDSLLNEAASRQLIAKAGSRTDDHNSPLAFFGYNAWRRDEFGDANLFDEQVFVARDGKIHFLDPRYDLEKFSPDGFSWGYAGSASAQLAIAMLMELLNDWERVKSVWPAFHDKFVVKLPRDANWTADGDTVIEIALSLETPKR